MTQSALPSRQGNTPCDDDIQKLCATYADVFSREEKPTPAYIETLTLHLKEDSDFHKRNRAPPRRQSTEQAIEFRIGSKRPKIFGTVDLTSGYHQAPSQEKNQRSQNR